MLGKRPFFFIIIVIASNAKLIAIINNANSNVLAIFFYFCDKSRTDTALVADLFT